MYDLPELREVYADLWHGLARAFRREKVPGVPDRLTHSGDPAGDWRAPNLLFSQTCGYPLTHDWRDRLQVVATPVISAPGCRGADYASILLVRTGDPARRPADLRGRVAVINSTDSQSGCNALRATVAPLARDGRFFGRVVESGMHAMSLAMVATGEADVCAVDCVTVALLQRYRPVALEGLRVLARTRRAPSLPYVTRADAPRDLVQRLRAGLFAAFADPAIDAAREAVFLEDITVLPDGAYDRILRMERRVRTLGYLGAA
jgi:ABC-type phosphate/phosphonate transport system substrate-binding protein